MRTLLAAVFAAMLVLVGYSFRAAPVSAQTVGDWLPFTAGEVLRLEVDLPSGVIELQSDTSPERIHWLRSRRTAPV